MLKVMLLAGAAATMIAPSAFAQANQTAVVEEVVVTGSRITSSGFQQPTPVTVVGEQELARQMPVTIANYLNQLPSFGSSTSARNPQIGVAGGGAEFVNLRNLGTTRTLVLLDNRRVVEAGSGGGVDTVTMPTGLIKRVEVVTGGASAAWGADAVAGVVNFVLNREFQGVDASIEAGITGQGDYPYTKVKLTGGRQFADGRVRLVGNFSGSMSGEGVDLKDRGWFKSQAIVNNPAFTAGGGQPRQIIVENAAPVNVSAGGIITSGPLRGIQFVGPNGTPVPYNFGNQSGLVQWGGDVENINGKSRAISAKLNYANTFAHLDYNVTDNITAYVEGSYDTSEYQENGYLFYMRQGNLPISIDNPYLDAGIRAQLVARGQTSFQEGLVFTAPGPPRSYNRRNILRGVVGLDGKIGESWDWHAYYTHGEAKAHIKAPDDVIIPRFLLAVDAVRSPSGAIVCRSTLTNPNNGCVPLNTFGVGVATPEAIKYVVGTALQLSTVTLDVVSADASGTLFSLPAGDVSVAFGADYIKNKASSTQDDLALNRQFAVQNFQPFSGERSVKEAFVEATAPILRDVPLANRLEVNAAARVTDYSTSGKVTTWKVGVSDQVTDEIRVRATKSRDIRAPTLLDLFSGGTFTNQVVFDPFTQKSYSQFTNSQGNSELQPEDANTFTAGIVYSPGFVSGLQLSVDYYSIELEGAIATVGAPTTLLNCFNGQTQFCSAIHRDASGAIVQIDSKPTNIASTITQGWDFEAAYRHPLGPGSLTVRALATNVPVYKQTDVNGVTTKIAGQVGELNGGQPKLKGNLNASYDQGPFSISMNARYVGKAKLQNNWVTGVDISDNSVDDYLNVGLTGVYRFELRGAASEFTVGIDNLFDVDPVIIPVMPGTVPYQAPGMGGRFDLYDPIGRSFRVGLRAKY